MTTSVLPLSAFLKLSSLFCFKLHNAFRSFRDKLRLGLVIFNSAICCLTSSRYVSKVTNPCMGGFQFDLT